MIGYHGICLIELQFWTWIAKKILARLEPCAGNCRSWMMGTWEVPKDLQGSEWSDEKKKRWLRRRGNWSKGKNTEDGVNFRGEGCNVPLIHPKKFRFSECMMYSLFWCGAQGQGPARRKMIKINIVEDPNCRLRIRSQLNNGKIKPMKAKG